VKKIIKFLDNIGLFKVKNPIEVFVYGGIVEKNKSIKYKVFDCLFLIFSIVLLLFVYSFNNELNDENSIYLIVLIILILILGYIFYQNDIEDNKIYEKHLSKYFKKKIKKDYQIDLKDNDFKIFINKYYFIIRNKKLGKKKLKRYLSEWKTHEEELEREYQKREEKRRQQLKEDYLKKLEKLQEEYKDFI